MFTPSPLLNTSTLPLSPFFRAIQIGFSSEKRMEREGGDQLSRRRGRGKLRAKQSMGQGDSELGQHCVSSGARTDGVEEAWEKLSHTQCS